MTIYMIAFSHGTFRHVNWACGYRDRLHALAMARSLNTGEAGSKSGGHWYVAKCQVQATREVLL